MDWERRPEAETPVAEQRTFRDDRGRQWTGIASSGTQRKGEEHAEVMFVCDDQPSEHKRVARVRVAAAEVGRYWRDAGNDEVLNVFRRATPA